MAGMRTRDVARAKKTYPTSRSKSSKRLYSEVKVKIEVGELEFEGQESRTLTFDESYDNVPHIALGVHPAAGDALVNAYVVEVTTTTCKVETTGPFNGKIYVHAMEMAT